MDILSIVTNSDWQHSQVGYHFTRVIPPDANGLGKVWEMKSKEGWPADVDYFDDKFYYLTFTEADGALRNDPRAYKRNVGPEGKGWPCIPRQVTTLPIVLNYRRAGDSKFQFYEKCALVKESSLGVMQFTFDGPFTWAWGGDLGVCPTYMLNYVYNSGKSKERFLYAMRPDSGSYGWCGWQLFANGVFVMESMRNTIVKQPPPVPANPCGL